MTALPHIGRARRTRLIGWYFFLPFAIVFLLTIVLPLCYAIGMSLFQTKFIGGTQFAGLANFLDALGDPSLYQGLGRVVLFMLIQVPVILVIAVLVSMAIDSGKLAFAGIFRLGIFVPYAIPTVIAALMWGYLYGPQFGLVGQISHVLGLGAPNLLSSQMVLPAIANISIWQFTGYNMLIFYAALQGIPRELYEAAAIDGAGQFRIAWSIKVPAILPAVGLAAFFSVIGGIQLFTEPSVLKTLAPTVIGSDFTPSLYMYNLAIKGSRFEYSAAIAVLMGLATILIVVIAQVVLSRRARRSQ